VRLFTAGSPAGEALERLAEDGDPEAFVAQFRAMPGICAIGRFLHDEPSQVTARPGERLVFAAMFAQSNDLFFAPEPNGIPLFDASGHARSGDSPDSIVLWDAGTEVNEQPGAGPNQAPRQPAPGAGVAEDGNIGPVDDGFAYPSSSDVLALSITPERASQATSRCGSRNGERSSRKRYRRVTTPGPRGTTRLVEIESSEAEADRAASALADVGLQARR
jgi:hypothetical protein